MVNRIIRFILGGFDAIIFFYMLCAFLDALEQAE